MIKICGKCGQEKPIWKTLLPDQITKLPKPRVFSRMHRRHGISLCNDCFLGLDQKNLNAINKMETLKILKIKTEMVKRIAAALTEDPDLFNETAWEDFKIEDSLTSGDREFHERLDEIARKKKAQKLTELLKSNPELITKLEQAKKRDVRKD